MNSNRELADRAIDDIIGTVTQARVWIFLRCINKWVTFTRFLPMKTALARREWVRSMGFCSAIERR